MTSESVKFLIVLVAFAFISSSQAFDCKDNPDGNYPIPNVCAYFDRCEGGVAYGWVCLADLFYNPNIDNCAWPDVEWCSDYPVPKDCSQTHPNGLIPSNARDNCKSYIQCSTGQQVNCPGETRFNPARRGCDSPTVFRCNESDD